MTWEDAESRPLEGQVTEIATQILVMGAAMLRDWQQQRYCDAPKDRESLIEKARLNREAEARAEHEPIAREQRGRSGSLLADGQPDDVPQDIRAYVRGRLEGVAARPGSALQGWADRALWTADQIDPLGERLV